MNAQKGIVTFRQKKRLNDTMRQQLVAANWKMNKSWEEGVALTEAIVQQLQDQPADQPVVLAVPFIHIKAVSELLEGNNTIRPGVQNIHTEDSGAYTGEISAPMAKSAGAEYAVVGHSERRKHFNETDGLVLMKLKAAHQHSLKPILCCGEPLEVREQEEHKAYVSEQLTNSLLKLSAGEMQNTIVAYEPIWAIGTGKTATPEQAQEMHAHIREQIAAQFGSQAAENTTILYGGSCKPANAESLFSQPDVDGGLIGGASLVADDFVAVVRALNVNA